MNLLKNITDCLFNWKNITNLDYSIINSDGSNYISTTTEDFCLSSILNLSDFFNSEETTISMEHIHASKLYLNGEASYLLLIRGENACDPTLGKLAVCQVESLLLAYHEKSNKSSFMQNLLLGNYSESDLYNKAKQFRIPIQAPRVIFLIETKEEQNDSVLATIRNIFSARTRDFITTLPNKNIVIIKELLSTEDSTDIVKTAYMLVDMLNTEVMTAAWVSFGSIADNLSKLPSAFQEAKTALEIGKIFNAQKNVFSYSTLGIGRLIYQLPDSVCSLFIDEILKKESLDTLDDETLNIIKVFFENNLNLSETARQLYVHRNTLVYRFEKLQKKYGLDIRTFEDAMTFKLAMMVVEYMKYKK